MHLADILARDTLTLSFEFFPPKSDAGWDGLFRTIAEFEPLAPSFVSVTYGAGGSTRDNTHRLVTRLRRETTIEAVPHLTCFGHTKDDIRIILEGYAVAGVSNILALRGDPPTGARFLPPGDFPNAADLVRFLKREGERLGVNGGRGFGIGVAGFPEGHSETPNTLLQIEHLKAKVDAGANYIVTQLFFDNSAFHDWRARCELAGIRTPIIAGIMPITSVSGLKRMAELAGGTRFPASLLKAIDRCKGNAEAIENAGIHWATEQCRDLLDLDVRGIHFYTLNKSDATKRIYRTLGVRPSP
ncbi:MAG: methylenetetrahydrofolate reductase [NAD(P)H] [Planctomycetota bacterium]|jgi:methylenetetrahydrofolate reductase (NADPH)|nr:MAG: methylenetetrahydrofolate reductase [NAD(P)H] [Planctomycetota bacterium]RLS93525.1 MAG: methylenetetrahydrofolate reductase [NAD(P)H] [Planctomycetota bacterium]